MAKNLTMPFRGIQQAEQQFDRGGFPGTVGPEQAEHLATPDIEIDIVHRARLGPPPKILEYLGQAADGNNDFAGFLIFDFRFGIGFGESHLKLPIQPTGEVFPLNRVCLTSYWPLQSWPRKPIHHPWGNAHRFSAKMK